MMRTGAFSFLLGISLVACTSGDSQSMMANDLQCSAQVSLTGTFTPDGSRPAAYDGCWGAGTWMFTASITSSTCDSNPAIAPSYQFTAKSEADMNGDPIVDVFTLNAPDPSTMENIVKISQLGNSMCEGEVDICSPDMLTVWQLRPDVVEATGNGITGQGEVIKYSSAHCPTM